ncbi:MAG: glycoside hydrolase family protein [Pirellulaceae bacterium]
MKKTPLLAPLDVRVWMTAVAVVLAFVVTPSTLAEPPRREVAPGHATTKPIPGVPLDLAGKRIVFTNWNFIQPGDLDWVNDQGQSVYVQGNEDLYAAHHVGKEAPFGIRIMARRPNLVGPQDHPSRCIVQDGNRFMGWTNNEFYESSDGLTWTKKANLTLDREKDGIHHVFLDASAPPAERFKAVWVDDGMTKDELDAYLQKYPTDWEPRALLHFQENGHVTCIRGSISPDGITWTTLPDPLSVEYADTLNTAYFDSVLRKYVLYTRYWSVGAYTQQASPDIRHSWTGVGGGAIGRSESDDFRHFPPSKMMLDPPPTMLPSESLYTNCYTTIPQAPDQHLMFPSVWNASIDDTTRIVLASSSDGQNWYWVPGGDLLETGEYGQWNGGCIWAHPNLIELANGDWALPYLAHNVPHKYPRGQRQGGLGYAIWPKGRMVALEAETRGQFTLMPLMLPDRVLRINAVTKRTGGVTIEVAGDPERTFEKCNALFGDLPWATVKWGEKADLGSDVGKPLTLRFRLDKAALYGIEFAGVN